MQAHPTPMITSETLKSAHPEIDEVPQAPYSRWEQRLPLNTEQTTLET